VTIKNRLWALASLLSAVLFMVSAAWFRDFQGFDPARFPVEVRDHPIQPAGYTFSIWGLILIWLVLGAGFGLLRRSGDGDWAEMRPWMTATLILGAMWLPVASLSPLLATTLLWLMLVASLRTLFRTGDTDRWLQQGPVAILAGWLTAAACVATGVVLGGYGLPLTPVALLMLCVAVGIAVTVQYRLHRAPEYGVTLIWALTGIIVGNTAPVNAAVTLLCIGGIIAIMSVRATDTE
jgi:hypothetical protein